MNDVPVQCQTQKRNGTEQEDSDVHYQKNMLRQPTRNTIAEKALTQFWKWSVICDFKIY